MLKLPLDVLAAKIVLPLSNALNIECAGELDIPKEIRTRFSGRSNVGRRLVWVKPPASHGGGTEEKSEVEVFPVQAATSVPDWIVTQDRSIGVRSACATPLANPSRTGATKAKRAIPDTLWAMGTLLR